MSKSILSVNGSKAMNYLLQTIFENEYRFLPAADVFEAMRQLKLNRQPGALIVDVDFNPNKAGILYSILKAVSFIKYRLSFWLQTILKWLSKNRMNLS